MDDSNSLLEHCRALIQLRNNYSTMQTGNLIPLKSNKPEDIQPCAWMKMEYF